MNFTLTEVNHNDTFLLTEPHTGARSVFLDIKTVLFAVVGCTLNT